MSLQEDLCEHVTAKYFEHMTAKQFRGPWTYLYRAGGECVGVDVPADGDKPGFRVMAEELEQ